MNNMEQQPIPSQYSSYSEEIEIDWRNHIKQYDVLSFEQFSELHNRMSDGLVAEELYDTAIATEPESLPELDEIIQEGKYCKQLMIMHNVRLVNDIAKHYAHSDMHLSKMDLAQEGYFGLVRAIEKYDPEKGFMFSTYASWWIRQSIQRAITEKENLVYLPTHIFEGIKEIKKVDRYLLEDGMTSPTIEDYEERTSKNRQRLQLLLEARRLTKFRSIDVSISSRGTRFEDLDLLRDFLSDSDRLFEGRSKDVNMGFSGGETGWTDRIIADPESLIEYKDLVRIVVEAINSLDDKEQQIIAARCGLRSINDQPMTLESIGKEFGLTRERIRQLEARAYKKMQHSSAGGGSLLDYAIEQPLPDEEMSSMVPAKVMDLVGELMVLGSGQGELVDVKTMRKVTNILEKNGYFELENIISNILITYGLSAEENIYEQTTTSRNTTLYPYIKQAFARTVISSYAKEIVLLTGDIFENSKQQSTKLSAMLQNCIVITEIIGNKEFNRHLSSLGVGDEL